MLSPEEIKKKLQDRNFNVIAEATGLHYNTVYKMAKLDFKKPSHETIKALSDYFEGQEQCR